ncbi:hypothetical protein M3906_003380 [Vibrio metschnikovii]|nr:hypothetical protein [Vibrio metschnikovii]
MDFYDDAKVKFIIRPQAANCFQSFDQWVSIDSDLWQKECIVQIRRYQSIECSDGFSMDVTDECWHDLQVFTFTNDLFDEDVNDNRQYVVGAAGFTKHCNEIAMLQFCWIHPFWRNRGLLKSSWDEFEFKLGEFYVSYPRSRAMQNFLDSIAYVEPKT